MYLARIDGTLVATRKHATLEGCRFLVAQRLEADGRPSGEPIVVLDRLGARRGTTFLVSTDGDAVRKLQGNTVPARLSVVGIVDEVVGGEVGR
jgi:ethanolamine utilization protein EutN